MSLLREYIRELLTEQSLKYSGILKLMPSPDVINQANNIITTLPAETEVPWWGELDISNPKVRCRIDEKGKTLCETRPLQPDKFHVTLVHQSMLKTYKKQLKVLDKAGWPDLLQPPPIVLDPQWEQRDDPELQRRSWVAWVQNQEVVGAYLNKIMEIIGAPMNIWEIETPQRRFHVSLANLTGERKDSAR
jgi:hypothetical protein